MGEGEEQKQVEEEEVVVESTERSTRLSPVEKVQSQRLDAATTTPWKAMVTLHSAGDNKRLYFLISRENEREEESGFHDQVCFFQQEKRGRGGGAGRGINVGNVFRKRQRTSWGPFFPLSSSYVSFSWTFFLTNRTRGKKKRAFVLVKGEEGGAILMEISRGIIYAMPL